MMKRLKLAFSTLALLIMLVAGASAASAAPTGSARAAPTAARGQPEIHFRKLPFLRGNASPQDLASKIADNLRLHPDGMHVIDPARCAKDGSCASPMNYLIAIRETKPGLQLGELVPYLSGLVKRMPTAEERKQKYDMDCIHPTGTGYKTIVNCMYRFLKPGEEVWVDPVSGEIIFAGDCTNRIRGVHRAPPCDLIVFETRVAGERRTHNPMWSPDHSDICYGVRDVVIENGDIRYLTPVRPIAPGCIDQMLGCNYDAGNAYVGRRYDADGTIDSLTPGLHAVLVTRKASTSAETKFGICLEYVDVRTGKRIRTSYTIIVRNVDFTVMPNGQRVAFVHYKRGAVPKGLDARTVDSQGNRRNMDPKSQYFWEDN